MTIKGLAKKIFLIEILKGMALTLKMMFTHAVTRQYPEEKREPFPGFRGLHALVRKEDGTARCVGCGLCAAICPSQCIHVYTSEGVSHEKIVDRYEIEVSRCVYCAFCVEACPFRAVVLTDHFEYAAYTRDDLYMGKEKLLSNWDRFMAGKKGNEYFEKFWHPLSSDFSASGNQAIFKKINSEG
ncbi:MAG: NADH-quinone oxidoreductase subunit NuoI [Thermodesulfovibrionales bacterium]|nr:NADH-quinone oxidoreductase subunit NuoI [Thermodesulfovibrionales bacterium]